MVTAHRTMRRTHYTLWLTSKPLKFSNTTELPFFFFFLYTRCQYAASSAARRNKKKSLAPSTLGDHGSLPPPWHCIQGPYLPPWRGSHAPVPQVSIPHSCSRTLCLEELTRTIIYLAATLRSLTGFRPRRWVSSVVCAKRGT